MLDDLVIKHSESIDPRFWEFAINQMVSADPKQERTVYREPRETTPIKSRSGSGVGLTLACGMHYSCGAAIQIGVASGRDGCTAPVHASLTHC